MAGLKYQKYIVDQYIASEQEKARDATRPDRVARLAHIVKLDNDIIPGSFHMGFVWALGASTQKQELEAHVHDFNEVLGWLGTDWKNPHDLGGEVEFWIEDEKYILKNSCIIFIPKGVKHCPLKDLKVDRPFIHFGVITKKNFKSSR
jgi:hypothetical protein